MNWRNLLREEMSKYAVVSTYLFVCFGVVILYEASMLDASGTITVSWTMALVKALVMGKFILIGDALSVGRRANAHPLLHRIAWKSLAMLALLVVFKLLEELIVGWVHGQTLMQSASELFEHSYIQLVAPVFLMLLVLIPLITASEIYRAVGGLRFRDFLLGNNA